MELTKDIVFSSPNGGAFGFVPDWSNAQAMAVSADTTFTAPKDGLVFGGALGWNLKINGDVLYSTITDSMTTNFFFPLASYVVKKGDVVSSFFPAKAIDTSNQIFVPFTTRPYSGKLGDKVDVDSTYTCPRDGRLFAYFATLTTEAQGTSIKIGDFDVYTIPTPATSATAMCLMLSILVCKGSVITVPNLTKFSDADGFYFR